MSWWFSRLSKRSKQREPTVNFNLFLWSSVEKLTLLFLLFISGADFSTTLVLQPPRWVLLECSGRVVASSSLISDAVADLVSGFWQERDGAWRPFIDTLDLVPLSEGSESAHHRAEKQMSVQAPQSKCHLFKLSVDASRGWSCSCALKSVGEF